MADQSPNKKQEVDTWIAWLHERGVLKDDDEKSRRRLNRLQNPQNEQDQACSLRLANIMQGDIRKHSIPDDVERFDWTDFPGYDRSVEWDFCRSPIARVQPNSGASFAHAPIVLQYYLRNRYLAANDPSKVERRSLDFFRYVRERFSADKLRNFIFEKDGDGGDSERLLRDILLPRPCLVGCDLDEIHEKMGKHGPALVTFEMHDDFLNGDKRQYFGQPQGEPGGQHAVLLVATRQEEDGRKIVLIQNWWKDKQWVEMDVEYLEECETEVVFVKTPQSATREELDNLMSDAAYTESHGGLCVSEKREGPVAKIYDSCGYVICGDAGGAKVGESS